MGCFSFICKECGKAIISNSFRGQEVEMFLLKNGKVLEHISGEYDSYGRVFIKGSQCKEINYPLPESKEWNMPWTEVCDLMFDDESGDGIATIHTKCYNGIEPTTKSKDDPNQGWGEDWEFLTETDKHRKIQ